MARKARIHAPGVFQHVMSRGIEGRDIFSDQDDRRVFLSLLEKCLGRAGHRCYAWALMPNHYHLLLRMSDQPLGVMMRRLNSVYARTFGKRHDRRGYLFQDRFRSIATHDQNYVLEIVRYIHLNPCRAGLCRDVRALGSYPWTGHAALMGKRQAPFQDCGAVLRCYATDVSRAREKYEAFIKQGLESAEDSGVIDLIRKSNKGVERAGDAGCWVVGDPEFVQKTLEQDQARRVRVSRYSREGWDLDKVLKRTAKLMNTRPEDILRRSRTGPMAKARKVFCYLAARRLEFSNVQIGEFLDVSAAAVSLAATKGEEIVRHEGQGTDI